LQDDLVSDLRDRAPLLVAYSGGVDSALVAALARTASLRSLAVTAAAETLAGRELDHARRLAREMGIDHLVVTYSELDDPEFVRNPRHRCYVCQGMRMSTMVRLAAERGFRTVCDGTNASDQAADRPGQRAVRENGVYSPLQQHGVDKATVRALAQRLGLSAWDRPANACLSSRIPHGQPVTLVKLRQVERAEDHLLELGFRTVRVRADRDVARVEVGSDEVARLRQLWRCVEPELLAEGFAGVLLDPAGYRSGGADSPRRRDSDPAGTDSSDSDRPDSGAPVAPASK
jgi:uncharacterized protein